MCGGFGFFPVVCGGLLWFAVICGGLSFSHTPSTAQFLCRIKIVQ